MCPVASRGSLTDCSLFLIPLGQACHLKNFGPKGYGFGGSVSGDYADRLGTPSPQSSPNKPRGGGILPLSAKAILRQQQQQQQQFNDYEDDGDTSSLPASPSRPSSRPGTPSRGAPSSDDRCRRCGQMAYFAERVRAANNTCVESLPKRGDRLGLMVVAIYSHRWHKLCLRCTQCSKSLDSNLLVSDDLPCVECARGTISNP